MNIQQVIINKIFVTKFSVYIQFAFHFQINIFNRIIENRIS